MKPPIVDTEALIDYVTEALYESVRPEGEGWDDLSAEDKANIREGAATAIQATTAWFGQNNIAVLPEGVMKRPKCREEAQAMMAAGMAYLKANPPPIKRPAIYMPGIK